MPLEADKKMGSHNEPNSHCLCLLYEEPELTEILVRNTGICNVVCTNFTRTYKNCSYGFHIIRCDNRNHIIGRPEFGRMWFKSHHIQHRCQEYWTQCSTPKKENLLRSTIRHCVLISGHLGKEI